MAYRVEYEGLFDFYIIETSEEVNGYSIFRTVSEARNDIKKIIKDQRESCRIALENAKKIKPKKSPK